MKRKYFVLRADSADCSACLEYYENEKKFKANCPPKRFVKFFYYFRSIPLGTIVASFKIIVLCKIYFP